MHLMAARAGTGPARVCVLGAWRKRRNMGRVQAGAKVSPGHDAYDAGSDNRARLNAGACINPAKCFLEWQGSPVLTMACIHVHAPRLPPTLGAELSKDTAVRLHRR